MKNDLKGITLVLFGILLCCAEQGVNQTVLSSFNDFPFSFFGILVGLFGLYLTFRKEKIE